MDKSLLSLANVKKIYGTEFKTLALNGIDLSIKRGEFISIIGPSGSGKSSLLNIIGTLDSITEGSYYFDRIDVHSLTQKELAFFRNQNIGFIFQFHHLLPEFTAIENVLMPCWIAGGPITEEVREKAERLLDIVGVSNRKDNKANNLSGGQQQRVAIARALMNNPKLILADEPTGNLDSISTEQVFSLLKEINQEMGTTFLIVTHDKNIAARCDRVIEVIDGKISCDRLIEKETIPKSV